MATAAARSGSGMSCAACTSAILGDFVPAFGRYYHPKHFTCSLCRTPLSDHYFSEADEPYCDACYQDTFSPRCATCQLAITDRIVVFKDQSWHVACFTCAFCSKALDPSSFYACDNLAFCNKTECRSAADTRGYKMPKPRGPSFRVGKRDASAHRPSDVVQGGSRAPRTFSFTAPRVNRKAADAKMRAEQERQTEAMRQRYFEWTKETLPGRSGTVPPGRDASRRPGRNASQASGRSGASNTSTHQPAMRVVWDNDRTDQGPERKRSPSKASRRSTTLSLAMTDAAGRPVSAYLFQPDLDKLRASLAAPTHARPHTARYSVRSSFYGIEMDELPEDLPLEGDDRRRAIVEEIYRTEEAYVTSLDTLVKVYVRPLEALEGSDGAITDASTNRVLFSNVELIQKCHAKVLEDIRQRWRSWSATAQIADVFFQMSDYLKAYQMFVNNYPDAVNAYDYQTAHNRRFSDFLERVRSLPVVGGQDLLSFLIMPVQRLPRYLLLLEDLLAHTDSSHPDSKNLALAVQTIKGITEEINEKRRDAEYINEFQRLSRQLIGFDGSIAAPHRRLLRFGPVKELLVERGVLVQRRRWLYLFNDLVLLVTPVKRLFRRRMQCDGVVQLNDCKIVDIDDVEGKVKHGLQLLPLSMPDASLTILCETDEEKESWMIDIFETSFELWEQDQMRLGKIMPDASEVFVPPS